MKRALPLLAVALTASLTACSSTTPATGGSSSSASGSASSAATNSAGGYVNVVKVTSITWFQRMDEGVKEWAGKNGVNAIQTGPKEFSPEQQASIVQSLIAQKPKAITVIPGDPDSMEGAVKAAKAAGIKVVSHEAATLKSADVNIEAFDNKDYGTLIMESTAKCMQNKGSYVQFVGSRTSESHMEWSKAEYELQQSKYPEMKRVTDIQESGNKADGAYEKAKQLLQTYPDLKGFVGASSEDVIGIARAIKEKGLEGDTCVFGTGVPSQAKQYMGDGAIDGIFLWDPKLAGEAILSAAKMLVEGKEVKEGTDLGVEGYNSLRKSAKYDKTLLGNAPLSITKDNLDKYNF